MLFAAPADVISAVLGFHPQLLSISDPNRTFLIEVPTASLMVAVTAILIRNVVLGLPKPWNSPRLAVITALAFAFTTSAWSVGSRALWQQTASMLFLSATLLAMQRIERSGRWHLLLGVFVALAYLTRPTNSVTVVLVAVWVIWRQRNALIGFISGIAVCAVPFALFSLFQYGTILPPYFEPGRLGANGPLEFWNALAVNLVSPSRGLLIYDPIIILAVIGLIMRVRIRQIGAMDILMVLAIAAQWVIVSAYGSTGGATYGPRLMLDIVPFLILLAVPTFATAMDALTTPCKTLRSGIFVVVAGVLFWGLFVNATGGLLRAGYCWSAYPTPIDSQPARVWDWSDPQLLRPYRDLVSGRSVGAIVAGSCRAPTT